MASAGELQATSTRLVPDAGSAVAVFVLEQTLGHVTHSANLKALTPALAAGAFTPEFVPIEFSTTRRRERIPGLSNWTVRAGAQARRGLRDLSRRLQRDADVAFVHTQVPAVLLGRWMRRIPTVVSLDATPLQYDELGEFYAHRRAPARVERVKHALNRRCLERAAHVITWSEWAKQGVVAGYGLGPDRITAIAPGVDLERWRRTDERRPAATDGDAPGAVRVLFVGGDLRRKGGDLLIQAVQRLRDEPEVPEIELHLVTTADVDPSPGVSVHRGLTANSPALIEQYHRADIFCLPTLGDCLPMVLAEAAAAGLPLVSTDVGAIHEVVRTGETGELVPPGDLEALTAALRRLVTSGELRLGLGAGARRLAEADHDARKNAGRIVETMVRLSSGGGR